MFDVRLFQKLRRTHPDARKYIRTRYQYHSSTLSSMYQYHVICGMYVVQQFDTAFGCCCSCHTSTAPVVVFYIWYEYACFGTINTYQVCESAAVCVYTLMLELLLLLLLLLLMPVLFIIVHLPPEVFFIRPLVLVERTNVLYCWSTPLGRTVALVRTRLYLLLYHNLSSPRRACAKPEAGVSPPRRSPLVCMYGF